MAVAFSLIPALFVAFLVSVMLFFILLVSVMFGSTTAAQEACGPTGSALAVDPASVPPEPIAGYSHEQLVNAAHIMLAAQQLGLSARDQQIGVATAMGESSLRVIDYGDDVGPDSRGLFQQRGNGAWGTYEDRMDPLISATNFFKVEMTITGREHMEPTLVSHRVQRNADPQHYKPYWEPAGTIVSTLGGITTQTGTAEPGQSQYFLGPVQPQTVLVANTLGPQFGIKTIGGYRPPLLELYDQSGHPAGLALDFMTNDIPDGKATGDRLVEHLQDHSADLGVKYIIWQQHIWSVERADEGWRIMEDRGSHSANHMDHVHLSLTGNGASVIPGVNATMPGCNVTGQVSPSGWAAPAQGPLTSDFGERPSPGGIGSTWHRGIDLAGGGCSKPIWAAKPGQVKFAGPTAGYGNLIEIVHGNGISTRYAHMYDGGLLVKTGDQVTAGQQIGRVGNSGKSTGCHLHFEILVNGRPVDPEPFLTNAGVTIP